jgi:hypothetical protein
MGKGNSMKLIYSLITMMLILQGCSKVEFKKANVVGLPSTTSVIQAIADCNNNVAQIQEQEFPVDFDNPLNEVGSAPVCAWNQSGNTAMNNGYATARYAQLRELNLPAGAIVCGAQFIFATQAMQYDDDFFFTVNNYIIASNNDYWQNNFMQTGILPISASQDLEIKSFSWNSIVGMGNYNKTGLSPGGNYCLGQQEGLSSCSWPKTQVAGSISMSISSNITTALGLTSQSGKMKLSFITTGDDNAGSDCQHEPLSMRLKIRYLVR